MVQLRNQRTILFLYGILVILPAVVFGALLWDQITTDHQRRLAQVPTDANYAATRILDGVEQRAKELFESELARPFYHYQQDVYEGDATTDVIPYKLSPLWGELRPEGILAWYSFDGLQGPDTQVELFYGDDDIGFDHEQQKAHDEELVDRHLASAYRSEVAHAIFDEIELLSERDEGSFQEIPLRRVAINLHRGRDLRCVERDLIRIAEIEDSTVEVFVTPFEKRVVRDIDDRLAILFTRRVHLPSLHTDAVLPACFDQLQRTTYIVQGFLLDPQWLLVDLPTEIAQRALGTSEQLLLTDYPVDNLGPEIATAQAQVFDRLRDFEFEHLEDRDMGLMRVAIDEGQIAGSFREQRLWFIGVAGVMIVSLVIGMRLLMGSVRASQEEMRRTENFVAAVTHELRTPVAAVKLYGEMLQEGWMANEAKRVEYLDRIVHEADRLDTLVDRVIEKRRLREGPPAPEPGDLGTEVAKQMEELTVSAGVARGDVVFDLAEDLPPVQLTPEGVHGILVNLVENARKYAPVDRTNGAEPIRVATRRDEKGRVVLEVLDRGPGIPADQRTKVFDAFYRLGDEATRRTPGTGLGLHLVALTARALGARVQALPRPGGGSIFRVTFKTLKPGART